MCLRIQCVKAYHPKFPHQFCGGSILQHITSIIRLRKSSYSSRRRAKHKNHRHCNCYELHSLKAHPIIMVTSHSMSALTISSQIHSIQQTSRIFVIIKKSPNRFDIIFTMSYPSGDEPGRSEWSLRINHMPYFARLRVLKSLLYDTHYLLRVSLDFICLTYVKFVIYRLFNFICLFLILHFTCDFIFN